MIYVDGFYQPQVSPPIGYKVNEHKIYPGWQYMTIQSFYFHFHIVQSYNGFEGNFVSLEIRDINKQLRTTSEIYALFFQADDTYTFHLIANAVTLAPGKGFNSFSYLFLY